jgi:hypothetical protein
MFGSIKDFLGSAAFGNVAPLVAGGLSFLGQRQANQAGIVSAREQMAFQKYASQHQYQWAVDDMKAAGINPMVAYKLGGSGNLGGAMYQPQNAVGAGVNSAIAAAANVATVRQIRAQTKLIGEQTKIASRDALIKSTQADALKWALEKAAPWLNSAKTGVEIRNLEDLTPDKGGNVRMPEGTKGLGRDKVSGLPHSRISKWFEQVRDSLNRILKGN